ncbi:MAG: hypothetical protein Q8P13_05430 [bacterium]|nr:hypothetical protein [bacterium]
MAAITREFISALLLQIRTESHSLNSRLAQILGTLDGQELIIIDDKARETLKSALALSSVLDLVLTAVNEIGEFQTPPGYPNEVAFNTELHMRFSAIGVGVKEEAAR